MKWKKKYMRKRKFNFVNKTKPKPIPKRIFSGCAEDLYIYCIYVYICVWKFKKIKKEDIFLSLFFSSSEKFLFQKKKKTQFYLR